MGSVDEEQENNKLSELAEFSYLNGKHLVASGLYVYMQLDA